MAYQEFWCLSGGSNMNGGSEGTSTTAIDTSADVTSTNGAWDLDAGGGTSLFTCSDTPTLVAGMVGMYAAIYKDGNTTPTNNEHMVCLIMAIDNTAKTVTLSATIRSVLGTAIADQANGYSIKIGGAWLGPSTGSVKGWPFGFITAAATNSDGTATPRVNLIGTFTTDAGISNAQAGPLRFEGCATTAGDEGQATIDASDANATILSSTGANNVYAFLTVQNNATGNVYGFYIEGTETICIGCVANDIRRDGFSVGGNEVMFVECEAYNCNTAAGSYAGFSLGGRSRLYRCLSHDNGSGGRGFAVSNAVTFIECIAGTNGDDGVYCVTSTIVEFKNCDFYSNGGDGIEIANTAAGAYYIENCNFVKNGAGGTGYGIKGSGAGGRAGAIVNCGFGAGTQANATGTYTGEKSMSVSGSVTYTDNTTPWDDPADGDFTLANVASATKTLQARGTGRGNFTQTASGYGDPVSTTSKPDIGAALRGGVLPAVDEVEDGVFYGASGTEFEGTLAAGGGGGGFIQGSSGRFGVQES